MRAAAVTVRKEVGREGRTREGEQAEPGLALYHLRRSAVRVNDICFVRAL